MTNQSTKKVLTNDAKRARMINWLTSIKVDTKKVDQLIEKYGIDYSYQLVLDSMVKPYELAGKLGTQPQSSSKMVNYILDTDISADKLGKALGVAPEQIEQKLQTNKNEPYSPTELPAVSEDTNAQKRIENTVDQRSTNNGQQQGTLLGSDELSKASVNMTVEQQFADIKGDKDGELSFTDLEKYGITPEEIAKYISPEDLAEIHSGKTCNELIKRAKKVEIDREGSGYCLAAVQDSLRYVSNLRDTTITKHTCYPKTTKLTGSSSNSACFTHEATEQLGCAVFKMKNDPINGNPCLHQVCAGAIVNYDAGPATIHGHTCISGGNGFYYSDTRQQASTIASGRQRGGKSAVYGDSFYVSYPKDCTLSDDLVKKILKERELERLGVKENELPEFSRVEPVRTEKADSLLNANMMRIEGFIRS